MLKARKWLNFPTLPLFEALAWGNPLECGDEIWCQKTRIVGPATRWWRNLDASFLRFDNTGSWRTDGHVAIAKTCASIASRGQKWLSDVSNYRPIALATIYLKLCTYSAEPFAWVFCTLLIISIWLQTRSFHAYASFAVKGPHKILSWMVCVFPRCLCRVSSRFAETRFAEIRV